MRSRKSHLEKLEHNKCVAQEIAGEFDENSCLICTDGSLFPENGVHSVGCVMLGREERQMSQRFLGVNRAFELAAMEQAIHYFGPHVQDASKVFFAWDQPVGSHCEKLLNGLKPYAGEIKLHQVFSHAGFLPHNKADKLAKKAVFEPLIRSSPLPEKVELFDSIYLE